ncbi:hypothetical protein RvY_03989 [Ramazzottius varieornatus]|uniref:RGS domain-containing protein n=1 Tax=Ramazzottius varieornatus TaxID=947166 RepID=A0A1D1UTF8_RAMVA|nr:hypothetical protein RvY_03989 [Ramazzottius varieornatus]
MSKPEVIFISVWKGHHSSYGITLLGNGPCIVSDVSVDGPAAKAGVQPGLVVLEVGGKNVVNKNHKEVRQMIQAADVNLPVQFKFSTLDSACLFFGNELKSMYESCFSKKRRSSGATTKLQSPKKSVAVAEKSEDNCKENKSKDIQPHLFTPPKEDHKDGLGERPDLLDNYQRSRDIARWMRRNMEDSPSQQQSPVGVSPLSSSSITTEFCCLYYSNLVDLLGSMEENVFQKNVQYLKSYKVPPQFWCRLVVNTKTQNLSIYRPEGKYAVYTSKNLRQVFVHPDGQFLGLSTVRTSKVATASPDDAIAQASMDVYSCHILCVETALHFNRTQQRQVLTQLLGPDKALALLSNAQQYFPLDASEAVQAVSSLSDALPGLQKPAIVKKHISTDLDEISDVSTLSGDGTPDVTVELNSANVLRNSMRKYGPYASNLRRNSISSDSLSVIPTVPSSGSFRQGRSVSHRYSCMGTYKISEGHEGPPCDSLPSVNVAKDLSSVKESPARDVVSSLELAHPADEHFRPEAFSTPGGVSQKSTGSRSGKMTLTEVLQHPKGLNIFQAFLASEHSEENINFWLACQEYRLLNRSKEMKVMAKKMYEHFIAVSGREAVNVDGGVRSAILDTLEEAHAGLFDAACKQVFDLMKSDSFPRFLTSSYYLQLRQMIGSSDLMQQQQPDFNQSMPCLIRMDSLTSTSSHNSPLPARRQSALFGWMKKKSDTRLSTASSTRRSLPGQGQLQAISKTSPGLTKPPSNVSWTSDTLDLTDDGSHRQHEPGSHNPIRKLLDRGRKSLSARVKPAQKRESLMSFVSETESFKRTETKTSKQNTSPVSFQFRRPLTPPPSRNHEVQLRRGAAVNNQTRSAGRDQKRLSLQATAHRQLRPATEAATEWTFTHSSSLDLNQVLPTTSSLTRASPVGPQRRKEIPSKSLDF